MSKAKPKRLTIDSLYDQLFAGIPVIDEGVIGDYYHQSFREDVRRFVGPELPTVFGTQSFGEGGGLDRVPNERWATFLVCLYFTVLVDQAMHEVAMLLGQVRRHVIERMVGTGLRHFVEVAGDRARHRVERLCGQERAVGRASETC
jgi:hypothetical protein